MKINSDIKLEITFEKYLLIFKVNGLTIYAIIKAKINGYRTLNKKYKLNKIIIKKINKEKLFKFTIDFLISFILNHFDFDNTNSSFTFVIFRPFSFNIVKKVLAVP